MNSSYAASKLCRACLSDHEDMQDIFQTCFVEVFEYCTSLQVSVNDGLPSALCKNCVDLLNTCYYFKQQCIRSDETLKQIILAPQVNDTVGDDLCPNLKYLTVFPLDQKYEENLPSDFSQHVTEEKKEEVRDVECINSDDLKCNNLNGVDLKCNYQDDIKTDDNNCSKIYCKDMSPLSTKLDTSDATELDKPQLRTVVATENLLVKKVKLKPRKGAIKCPKCDKIFKTSHMLDAHIREHYGLKPFVCKLCQKEFANRRNFKMHTFWHEGKRRYKCDICKKAFTYSSVLAIHKKIHLGTKMFRCTKCDASFIQSSHLRAHMSTHSTEQPYSCLECHKSFKTNDNLKSHLRRHKELKNYVCSICGKRFVTNGDLTAHMRSHNSERKFQCTQCNKAYNRKCLLVSHLQTHNGEYPYKCKICSKIFKSFLLLKKHHTVHNDHTYVRSATNILFQDHNKEPPS